MIVYPFSFLRTAKTSTTTTTTTAPVVLSGLKLRLDAASASSYPGSGTTWYDTSGNGVNYTLQNGPTYNSSTASGVIVFNSASSQYVNSSSTLFNSSTYNTYTINIWVYPTSAGNLVQVDGQSTPRIGYHYSAIEITAAGLISFGQWTGAMTTITTSSKSLNAWYNLVISYNGTTANAYINGVTAGSANISWSSPGANTFIALMAADATDMGTNAYASGYVGAFYVYNIGLSYSLVTQNFNALRSRFGI